MKGLLIFNRINDLMFMKYDDEFVHHVSSLAVKNGLLSGSTENNENGLNRNVVVQIFSPLIASQKVMQIQLQNPYSSTECKDGTVFVFAEYLGYMFIQITKTDEMSLSSAQKHLAACVEFVKFLCGTSVNVLSDACPSLHEGCLAHRLLLLIDAWTHLHNTQQMFLVEGIERLIVNRNMSNTCIDILEIVLAKLRATNKGPLLFCHSFFLVGTKLLSLFSSRNSGEISKGSLLQLIALSQALHSAGRFSSDGISSLSHSQSHDKRNDSTRESGTKSPSVLHKALNSTKFLEDSSFGVDMVATSETRAELLENLRCQLVFLKTKQSGCLPHVMFSLNVSGLLYLVVVCEVTNKTTLSLCLSNCLNLVHSILNASPVPRCLLTKTSLQPAFQKVIDALRKTKITPDLERFCRIVMHRWQVLKQSGLLGALQKCQEPLPPHLETLLVGLLQSLQDAFENVVLRAELHYQLDVQVPMLSALHLARSLVQKKLQDYLDYLTVKAMRNITMTTYLQDYPGLLHFIYVDRNNHCMLAPSVGDCVQLRQEYIASLTKENVWKTVETVEMHLQKGDLGLLWQDDGFFYSYSLWFEDPSGKALKPKKVPTLKNYPPPGIICGDFYRLLMEECFPSLTVVHCFELYCIHVGVATPPFILEQTRRLASAIWETASLVNSLVSF